MFDNFKRKKFVWIQEIVKHWSFLFYKKVFPLQFVFLSRVIFLVSFFLFRITSIFYWKNFEKKNRWTKIAASINFFRFIVHETYLNSSWFFKKIFLTNILHYEKCEFTVWELQFIYLLHITYGLQIGGSREFISKINYSGLLPIK